MSARHQSRRWVSAISATIALAVGACGGDAATSTPTPTPACSVSSVTVVAPVSTILPGATTTLSAAASTSNCTTAPATSWSSSNASVATVSSAGTVTGIAAGSAVITATIGGTSGAQTITVSPPPVNTIEISAATGTLIVGQTLTLVAMPKDAQGALLSGRTITWSSSNAAILTVQSNGLVAGIALGTATITATSEGKTATSVITVTVAPVNTVTLTVPSLSMLPNGTQQAVAELRDATNQMVTGRTVVWTASNVTVAVVSASGMVTAVAPGTGVITATSEGKSASVTITVTAVPVNSVSVVIGDRMLPGATQQASAVMRDASAQVLNGRSATWSSSNAAVATVNASGLVTGIAPGTAVIIATSEGKTGSATITVTLTLVPVRTVTVTVPSLTMALNVSQQATAVARDSLGNVLTGLTVVWSSSNAAVGTVQTSGLVTSIAPGLVAITATVDGKSGSVAISVPTPPAPTLIAVTPVLIDAVFSAVPIALTGTNFMSYASGVNFTGVGIAGSGFTVNSASSISIQMNIAGGTPTTTSNVSVTNFGGTTSSRAITVYAVGSAPPETGPRIGTTPATWEGIDCPSGTVATGANVRMGAFLDNIQMRCQSVTGTARTFGGVVTSSSLGGTGGLPGTLTCSAGSVMTGVSGTYTSASVLNIVTLAAICAPIGGGATFTSNTGGGAPGAAPFTSSCPVGLAVTGMAGAPGTLVPTIQLTCR